ncbi:hypothetical protein CYY_000519 [Polysphondylium violaceum]|uniref:Uncharacterized protein n=1 Tax=Polysphondylium violaceum TaxID=133409 RepID=A0A8J4V2B0_9MYCE|nr:hypothetical protein CYY_000519 [Polysphondylium violaceum]
MISCLTNTGINLISKPFSKCLPISTTTSYRYYTKREHDDVEKQWFKPKESLSSELERSNKESKPLVVFLEGPSGSGKRQLLERLSNTGYHCIIKPFIDVAKDNAKDILQPSSSFDIKNQSKLYDQLIKDNLNQSLLNSSNKSKDQAAFKNNLLFVHRSPISSIIYDKGNNQIESINKFIQQQKQQEKDYNVVYVYCKTPVELIQQRLGGRYHFNEDQDNQLVSKLNITDLQEFSEELYSTMEKESVFDEVLDTTSIKQACPSLLAMFNIYFNNDSLQQLIKDRLNGNKK